MTTSNALKSNINADDHVDEEIAAYTDLAKPRSFFLFAGAGSGKTGSLVKALQHILKSHGRTLLFGGHRVGVITYTNAACDEINSRVDFHPLIYVSTIHSFAWELIQGFHHDIREWLRNNLRDEIRTLTAEEAKGRAGTKASIERQAKIASKGRRLDRLDAMRTFVYSPTGENREPNSLNHAEVIKICSDFIATKPLMRWVLVGRFPLLLIDESQDTNKNLVDALFLTAEEHADRFSLGLIGDVMQRIYADGKEHIEAEIPAGWAKPEKKLNHRCPKRIVTLINKIREPVDTHFQEPRSDAVEGHVRLFILPAASADKSAAEDASRKKMGEVTGDKAWEDRGSCKMLTLEHHMAARRLGFSAVFDPLYEIENWRTGLLDGSLSPMRFMTQTVLPLVLAAKQGDRFAAARILRAHSPLITSDALRDSDEPGQLLKKAHAGVNELAKLANEGEPACGAVLRCIASHDLLTVPDALKTAISLLKAVSAEPGVAAVSEDQVSDETKALMAVLEAPFSQIDLYRQYVSDEASFDTHQGVKGRQFDRVMVIMDDTEARGFLFGYGKLLGEKPPGKSDIENKANNRDSSIDRTRRLFYVTCSRAKKSLALVMYADNPAAVKKHVIDAGWFAESEIVI
jgi:DNA helicase-2/ATP-dependent DNA helicase PcrA